MSKIADYSLNYECAALEKPNFIGQPTQDCCGVLYLVLYNFVITLRLPKSLEHAYLCIHGIWSRKVE